MIGKQIVIERKKKKLTQEKLARSLCISRSSLSLYEIDKREPDAETLIKMANFFNITTDYLLTGIENSNAPLSKEEFISKEDKEWLELIHHLPIEKRYEFKGELKGYLKHMDETSVTADEPIYKKTGTENMVK